MEKNLHLSPEEAKEFVGSFKKALPTLFAYFDSVIKNARKNHVVYTYFGHPRRLRYFYTHEDRRFKSFGDRTALNCVDEETEILTVDGWKKHHEVSEGTLVATVNPETRDIEWQPITTVNRFYDEQGIDVVEFNHPSLSAVSTLNHRWFVFNKATKRSHFISTENLSVHGDHQIWRTANNTATDNTFSDDELRLIGWFLTDGDLKYNRVTLVQSHRANPENVDEIRTLLKNLGITYKEHYFKETDYFQWSFTGEWGKRLRHLFPKRVLTPEVALSLSKRQATLLLDTFIKGDGHSEVTETWRRGRCVASTKEKEDMFQMLGFLAGYSVSVYERDFSGEPRYSDVLGYGQTQITATKPYYLRTVLRRDRAQIYTKHRTHKSVSFVWCPTVPNSTWVARRKGTVYVTGNSPIQGGGADVLKIAMLKLWQNLYNHDDWKNDCNFISTIHDEINSQVKIERVSDFMKRKSELMQLHIQGWDVPMDVSTGIGYSWGELFDFKYDKENDCWVPKHEGTPWEPREVTASPSPDIKAVAEEFNLFDDLDEDEEEEDIY